MQPHLYICDPFVTLAIAQSCDISRSANLCIRHSPNKSKAAVHITPLSNGEGKAAPCAAGGGAY